MLIIVLALALFAGSQSAPTVSGDGWMTVTSAPLEIPKIYSHKAVIMGIAGVYQCPDGYDMYAERVRNEQNAKTTNPNQFDLFFKVTPQTVGSENALRESKENPFRIACLKGN